MIYLGADHGGFELKEKIKQHLSDERLPVSDLGAFNDEPSDYPDYAFAVAEKVRDGGSEDLGILICTTSIGTCVAANKIKGIRAAVGYTENAVIQSRDHVDANILCLGAREIEHETAIRFAELFIKTPFSGDERHIRRLSKIQKREQEE
jgi:ribose 5-phosphate isomerase B